MLILQLVGGKFLMTFVEKLENGEQEVLLDGSQIEVSEAF